MVKSDGDTPKSEKDPPPAQENTNTHPYSGWMPNQAYYGPGVPLQPPYVYSAVSAGHGPQTFVWAPPQPFLPPYGVTIATAYSHGGVYPHPAVPFVATSSRTEMPWKSSENMDQGLSKKFKKLDGFVGAVGCSSESDAGGAVHEASKRMRHGIVGSTDGSDENTGANQTQSRSGFEGMPSTGKSFGSLKQRTDTGAACGASTSGAGLPLEVRIVKQLVKRNWIMIIIAKRVHCPLNNLFISRRFHQCLILTRIIQKDERRLKREKRKHANRESARRSRLRKQVVYEELLIRYESFNVESMVLKSELNQLKEDSEKLRLENAALREKLDMSHQGEMVSIKQGGDFPLPISDGNSTGLNITADFDIRNVKVEHEIHEISNLQTDFQLLEHAIAAG